jgi:hypothetical protein
MRSKAAVRLPLLLPLLLLLLLELVFVLSPLSAAA